MAKSVKPSALGAAIAQELTVYHQNVTEKLDELSEKATKNLVKKTKVTAPSYLRGSFKKNIASKRLEKKLNGSTYVWYVKPPDHRLTHLLVHGHATKDGGRTRANPFLANALGEVLPDYENDVKEAIKNG
jgi:hypothetical protein